MTLERVYRDIILVSALIGLIVGSIIALYVYFTTYDTRILVFAVVMMLLGVLAGVATYVFRVEFWRAIFKRARYHSVPRWALGTFFLSGRLTSYSLRGKKIDAGYADKRGWA